MSASLSFFHGFNLKSWLAQVPRSDLVWWQSTYQHCQKNSSNNIHSMTCNGEHSEHRFGNLRLFPAPCETSPCKANLRTEPMKSVFAPWGMMAQPRRTPGHRGSLWLSEVGQVFSRNSGCRRICPSVCVHQGAKFFPGNFLLTIFHRISVVQLCSYPEH